MKPSDRFLVLALIVAMTCFAAAADLHAQGTPVSTQDVLSDLDEDQIGERASELVSRVRAALDTGERYLTEIGTANYEDSLVLRMQIKNLRVHILNDLHQLADVLLALERSEPQAELRAQVEDIYIRFTPRLWFHIERLSAEIDAHRALRQSTVDEERAALEDVITILTGWLDELYDLSMTQLDKMKALGLDTSQATDALSGLLASRADKISGRIDLAILRIDLLDGLRKESPDPASVMPLLFAAHKSLENNTTTMRRALGHMDTLELDTVKYREQLLTATRDLATGILNREVAVNMVRRWFRGIAKGIREEGGGLLFKALLFVGIMFLARFAARLAQTAVRRSLDASKLSVSRLLRRMIINTTANLVLALGLMLALTQIGVSLGPLLAGLGVAGFILGFALQDSLANFAAGMMILLYRPYDVGDTVETGGVFGKVDKMSLVSTTILTFDNQTMVVPNNKIWGDVIKNVTAQDKRGVDMVFGISYQDDIPKAERILEDILKQHDRVVDDPEPIVRVHKLNESSVDFVVRPWVAVDDYWDDYWDVTRAVKMRFDEEGVSIPFPQRDVHVYQQKASGVEPDTARAGEAMKQQKSAGLVQNPETEEGDNDGS